MIWLDGLDLPNLAHYPVHFVEHYQESRYPAKDVDTSSSPIVFPWSRMKEVLDRVEGEWAARPYLRANGSEGMHFHVVPSSFLGKYSHLLSL